MRLRNAALLCCALGIASACSGATAAEQPTLQERMSKEEFHAAELDKLSPDALKRLNDWLAAHPVTVTKLVTPSNKPVFYTEDTPRERIETRIDGLFTGWAGKTVFKLQNGQEWTQVDSGRCAGGKLHDPKVKIEPAMGGSWLLFVSGNDCDGLHVERTK
ncbi:hypothetical protein [Rudaea sp.]|uniref:hypothetical protein n=1 Tax=Rudaea sp. TaxID=2136325 RepID=UPI002ED4FEF6